METKTSPIAIKKIDVEARTIEQAFAITGNIDDGSDRIWPGAFAKTLSERGARVKALWQHNSGEPPVGVPLSLGEVGRDVLPSDILGKHPSAMGALIGTVKYLATPRGDEIFQGIVSGALTENSIGYDAIKYDFEGDRATTVRNLREVRLWDVSAVNWGMNPATYNNVKSAQPYTTTPLAPLGAVWDDELERKNADVTALASMSACVDRSQSNDKSGYQLLHHSSSSDHAVVYNGVVCAMQALAHNEQGTGVLDDNEVRKVYNHLAKHYQEFNTDAPSFEFVLLSRTLRVANGHAEALKSGRVLSAANLERVKNALAVLQELLDTAEPSSDDSNTAKTLMLKARLRIAELGAVL